MYLDSRLPGAVTPEQSKGVTRGQKDSKYYGSHIGQGVPSLQLWHATAICLGAIIVRGSLHTSQISH